jgi:hypothetical protein
MYREVEARAALIQQPGIAGSDRSCAGENRGGRKSAERLRNCCCPGLAVW